MPLNPAGGRNNFLGSQVLSSHGRRTCMAGLGNVSGSPPADPERDKATYSAFLEAAMLLILELGSCSHQMKLEIVRWHAANTS